MNELAKVVWFVIIIVCTIGTNFIYYLIAYGIFYACWILYKWYKGKL